jgi:hypothetical protein
MTDERVTHICPDGPQTPDPGFGHTSAMELELLLVLAGFGIWIYGLHDVIRVRDVGTRGLDRGAWSVVVFFGFAPGAIVWMAFGRPRAAPQPGEHDRIVETYPETNDELRERVRVRAESQRSGTNR